MSVRIKLHSSKTNLENILSIKKWESTPSILQQTASNATIGSGTIVAATPALLPSTQTMNLSRDLDGFFENLVSAFDILAQVVNLLYFAPPKNADEITFHNIVDELRDAGKQNESITTHFSRIRRRSWYRGLKSFRNCAIHNKSIQFRVQTKPSSFEPLQEYSPSHDVKAILLPDNPRSNQPIYKRRSVQSYCVKMFSKALDSIDLAFSLMENRIRTANRVPI